MLESLPGLKVLALEMPRWLSRNSRRPPCSSSRPPRSRLRLEVFEIWADAEWITDTRSTAFLDWLSTSGAISEIHQLRPGGLMLIDKSIMAAVGRMLRAVQTSSKLFQVYLSFGPDVDWTPRESLCSPGSFTADSSVASVHAPLAALPQLQHLHLACPYDAASLSQLGGCLSAILSCPEDKMHLRLYLHFDRYLPYHATEPPVECWERLDSMLQSDGLPIVSVNRRLHQCDAGKPVLWGNWYNFQQSDEWLEEARERFPKVCKSGRLWVYDARKKWYHVQCELSLFIPTSNCMLTLNQNMSSCLLTEDDEVAAS